MAAVRCAARRLGGSLLQRTKAPVPEEGRRLAPSRLMPSRELSSKVSGEQSQVSERHLLEPGSLMRSRQLASEHARNIQKKEDDIWAGFNETLKRSVELQKKKKPRSRLVPILGAIHGVVKGAVKLAFFGILIAGAFGSEGVKAQAVTNEDQ